MATKTKKKTTTKKNTTQTRPIEKEVIKEKEEQKLPVFDILVRFVCGCDYTLRYATKEVADKNFDALSGMINSDTTNKSYKAYDMNNDLVLLLNVRNVCYAKKLYQDVEKGNKLFELEQQKYQLEKEQEKLKESD